MRKIATADCETDPFKHGRIPAPFIWGYYDGDEYQQFYDTEEFVNFVIDKPIIIYAHNGGKFDWHFILQFIPEFTPIMVINGRLSKFKIGECEFRDSYNIIPIKLADYKKDDFDYTLLEREVRDIPENKKQIENYLKADCVYLFEIVERFINDYGLNLTLAGAAMKTWAKMSGIKPPRVSEMFFDEIKPFYYGGRVQCFETGIIKKELKFIDINSAYPFAMKELHPYGNVLIHSEELPKTRAYISRSFIRLSCISRGAFPLRTEKGLEFPDDGILREYSITGWEYLAGLDTGTISHIRIIDVIELGESIEFSEYINRFYKMKSDCKEVGDKAGYIFAKLFQNTLYGKYGSNPAKYSEYETVPNDMVEGANKIDGYSFCASFGQSSLVSKPLEEEKRRYFNPAVAASITGYVRAYLWRAINKCEGVHYCDTDSILCESFGSLELDPYKLGAWDLEAEFDEGAIAGKKLYAFRYKGQKNKFKIASKGGLLTAPELYSVAKGVPVLYKNIAPSFSLKNGVNFVDRLIQKTA